VPYSPQSRLIVHKQIKIGHAGNACPGHDAAANPSDEISSIDSEFLAGDDSSSEEDEEAKEILRRFKEFKKKLSSGQIAHLDDIFIGGTSTQTGDCIVIEDEGNMTPYAKSSDEDESFEDLGSDVDGLVRKESKYPRFSKKDLVPKFSLGMKFNGKRQFKKAIVKYALAKRKVIKFVKDEGDRVRAKCD
jgi:alpha-galactosidase